MSAKTTAKRPRISNSKILLLKYAEAAAAERAIADKIVKLKAELQDLEEKHAYAQAISDEATQELCDYAATIPGPKS